MELQWLFHRRLIQVLCLVLLLLGISPTLLKAQAPYCSDYLLQWKSSDWYQDGANSRYQALAVATDTQGNVFVTDQKSTGTNNTYSVIQWGVKKFSPAGQQLTSYTLGTGTNAFPGAIDIDNAGNMYIADAFSSVIRKFTSTGQLLATYASPGSGNGQINGPRGIAVDGQGNMYISDTGNHRIVKLNANGQFVASWGTPGLGVNQFYNPYDLDLDSQGNIYIADKGTYFTPATGGGNNRVVKLDANGNWLGSWGIQTTFPESGFNEPVGVAVDARDNVYVTDNLYVHKFDSNLNLLGYWGGYGSGNGQFQLASNVAVFGLNNIYVVDSQSDSQNVRIQKFGCPDCTNPVVTTQPVNTTVATGQNARFAVSATGTSLTYQWQLNSGSGFANLANNATYTGVSSATLSIANSSTALSGYQYRVIVTSGYCSTTATTATLTVTCATPVITSQPSNSTVTNGQNTSFAVTATGNSPTYQWQVNSGSGFTNLTNDATYSGVNLPTLSVTSASTTMSGYLYRVIISSSTCFTTSSAVTLTVSQPVALPCTDFLATIGNSTDLNIPTGVAVDGQGNVYVASMENSRLVKYNAAGQLQATWPGGQGNGEVSAPYGVAVDGQGNVYVADTYNNRIQKFSASGQFVTSWGSQGAGNNQFDRPQGVAVDGQGNIYVTDEGNSRVVKLSASGQWLGTRTGLNYPRGLAVSQGKVYVAESGSSAIVILNDNLQDIGTWGSQGSGVSQFSFPTGVAVDGQGNVYVADNSNNRVVKLDGNGQWLGTFGSQGSNDGQFQNPAGITVDSQGNIYVADSFNSRVQKFGCASGPVANGPSCDNYVTKKMADGLNSDYVFNVFALTGPGSTTVYAATSEGLNISTDGGQTFTNASFFGANDMFSLAGSSGTTLFVAGYSGLMISTDNGQTFTTRTTTDGLGNNYVLKVYAVGNNVYAATYGGVSISTDGGQTFTNKTTANGLVSNQVISVYAVGNTVYAITNNPSNQAGTTLHVSNDGGQTFTTRGPADGFGTTSMLNSAGANCLFAVGNTVYVGTGFGVYISTNGGQTFTARTTANGLGGDAVSDVQVIGNTVYAATDNGLSISTNGGQTFTTKTTANGLGANRLSAVYVVGNSIYIATQGGGISFCPPVSTVASLTLTPSATPNPVCVGSPVALSVDVAGGTAPYSYTWTAPAGVTLSATSTSAISATATTSGVQTFTVLVADAGGSLTSTATIDVTVNASPTATLTSSGTLSEANTTVTLTATPGALTYLFSSGASQINNGNTATVTTPGLYSVTLTAANGCSATATTTVTSEILPDLIPIMYASPAILYGNSPITVVVSVVEANGTASHGPITVYIAKDPIMNLSLNTSLNLVGGRPVQNQDWVLDNSNPSVYILTTQRSVGAGDELSFGLTGQLSAGNTRGSLGISAIVLGGSGGEVRITNNSDADRVDYFKN